MKRFLLLSIVLLLFAFFKTSSAQLPFYQFGLNIYLNDSRIADTNIYKVTHKAYHKDGGDKIIFEQIKPSSDTSKSMGYDYLFVNGGARLKEYTVQIIIEQMEDDIAQDVMWIEFDNRHAPLHSMLGLDKVVFIPGKFIFTEKNWPNNRRERPIDKRFFSFIEKDFDWESVKEKE